MSEETSIEEENPEPRIEPHPLFVPESEKDMVLDRRLIYGISVERLAPNRENAGRMIPPDELPDLIAIKRRFGGGEYQLRARDAVACPLKGGVRRVVIAGPPKPMIPDDEPKASPPPPTVDSTAKEKGEMGALGILSTLLTHTLTLLQSANAQAIAMQTAAAAKESDSQARMFAVLERMAERRAEAPVSAPAPTLSEMAVFLGKLREEAKAEGALIGELAAKAEAASEKNDDGSSVLATVMNGLTGLAAAGRNGAAPGAALPAPAPPNGAPVGASVPGGTAVSS